MPPALAHPCASALDLIGPAIRSSSGRRRRRLQRSAPACSSADRRGGLPASSSSSADSSIEPPDDRIMPTGLGAGRIMAVVKAVAAGALASAAAFASALAAAFTVAVSTAGRAEASALISFGCAGATTDCMSSGCDGEGGVKVRPGASIRNHAAFRFGRHRLRAEARQRGPRPAPSSRWRAVHLM